MFLEMGNNSASETRGRLEDAFASVPATPLRAKLRSLEQAARDLINGGSIKEVTANQQHTQLADYGPGQLTPLQLVEIYRDLVDKYDQAFLFLNQACKYGLDAFNVMFTCWPNATTTVSPPNLQVIIDLTSRWSFLCTQFSVDPALVIGAAMITNSKPNDYAIFLWMMYFIQPVVEATDDHSQIRISSGAQFS